MVCVDNREQPKESILDRLSSRSSSPHGNSKTTVLQFKNFDFPDAFLFKLQTRLRAATYMAGVLADIIRMTSYA
jgi:hypothetical protein